MEKSDTPKRNDIKTDNDQPESDVTLYYGNKHVKVALKAFPQINKDLIDLGFWDNKLSNDQRSLAIKAGVMIFKLYYTDNDPKSMTENAVFHEILCRKTDAHHETKWYEHTCRISSSPEGTKDPITQYWSFKADNKKVCNIHSAYLLTRELSQKMPLSKLIDKLKDKHLTDMKVGDILAKSELKNLGVNIWYENGFVLERNDFISMKEQLKQAGYFKEYEIERRAMEVTDDAVKFYLNYKKPGDHNSLRDSYDHILTFRKIDWASDYELVRHELKIELQGKQDFLYFKYFGKETSPMPDISKACEIVLPLAMQARLAQADQQKASNSPKITNMEKKEKRHRLE